MVILIDTPILVKLLLIFLSLIYLVFFLMAYIFADRLIFQPQPSTYKDASDIIKLSSEEGVFISAIYLPNPNAKKYILYSHGNAEDLGIILPILIQIRDYGFSVLAYDYRGYGTSDGVPSEKNSYKDVMAAYNYLTDSLKVEPQNIIAFGRSLGGGVATELAYNFPVGGLILESTFLSAYRVVTKISLFPLDKFNNIKKLKKINVPLLVIHGNKDEVIPFWHGEKLYSLSNNPKKFYIVDNARHNDLFLVAGEEYGYKLQEFLKLIKK